MCAYIKILYKYVLLIIPSLFRQDCTLRSSPPFCGGIVVYLFINGINGKRTKIGPSAKAIPVAVAYPNIPTNNAGNTKRVQFLACAIAAAVVGPPTLALLAKYNSLSGTWNIPRPTVSNTTKWMNICNIENTNNDGACWNTNAIDPDAPDAAKNICMNNIPMAVPAIRILAKNFGKRVAANTVMVDVSGNADVPGGNNNLVAIFPIVTKDDATAKDNEMVGNVISFRFGSTTTNAGVLLVPVGIASNE